MTACERNEDWIKDCFRKGYDRLIGRLSFQGSHLVSPEESLIHALKHYVFILWCLSFSISSLMHRIFNFIFVYMQYWRDKRRWKGRVICSLLFMIWNGEELMFWPTQQKKERVGIYVYVHFCCTYLSFTVR